MQGLSAKEIATTVGLTVSAVKTRLHRARGFLRERLVQVRSHANVSEQWNEEALLWAPIAYPARRVLRGQGNDEEDLEPTQDDASQ